MRLSLAAAATALFALGALADVDPIVIKGSKFFYKTNGTQFFMRGVAYQQEINSNTSQSDSIKYTDPLSDTTSCKRDIPYLAKLRTNTIRVYAINPDEDHDECMNALADAGIYVVADLSEPGLSIKRDDPEWNTPLYERYTKVIDVMAQYTNTLGFFAGNEVSNAPNNTFASAFVKAAVRDTKAYIKSKNYREIGVGYATNDDANIRENLADYFDCGNREDAIDFWGYNIYSWCGDSSYTKSGYDQRTKEFADFDIPVFFAEYGCNTPRPRKFTDVAALYGEDMTPVFSGGIVYMYFEEANEFGLVSINDGNVEPNDDFENLSKQIAKATPSGTQMSAYNPTNTAAASCPSVNSEWGAAATPLPPTANAQLCSCMMDSIGCVVQDNVDEDDYGDLFGTVCGFEEGKYCAGVNKNLTIGPYGVYGMCAPKEQLAFALNAYYEGQNKASDACDFKGSATIKAAASTTAANCQTLMAQAGEEGTGTVTASPGAASATSTSSTGAAPGTTIPRMELGMLGLGLYIFGAVASGVAMILL